MPYGIRDDVWNKLPPEEQAQIAAAAKEQPPPPTPPPPAPHPVQPEPATDALVPPGARVADRPGVTLLEAPTRIEAPAPALHSEQPEPATDALVPAGARIQERPGITLIPAPTRTPPPPSTIDTPQATSPTDALVPKRVPIAQRPGITLIPWPARASPPGSATLGTAASGRTLAVDLGGGQPARSPEVTQQPTRVPKQPPGAFLFRDEQTWPGQTLDGAARVTVRVDATLSGGKGPIAVGLNGRTGALTVSGAGFRLSDEGIVSASSKIVGANWGGQFGFHAGASGSVPLDHPGGAKFAPSAGVGRTLKIDDMTLDYSADIAPGGDPWRPLAYVESVSATVTLPRQSGKLSYSITLTIEPTARPPRPVNVKPWAAGAEAALAAGLAALMANAYFGSVGGTRIPRIPVADTN